MATDPTLFVSNVNSPISGPVVNVSRDAAGIPSATPAAPTDQYYSSVLKYDANTGAYLGTLVPKGTIHLTSGITINGNDLFANDQYYQNSDGLYGRVMEFNYTTGQLVNANFISGSELTAHGLDFPEDIIFGPDGNAYVSGLGGGGVQEFNGSTGTYIKTVASQNSLGQPLLAAGLNFGPDGNLYISSEFNCITSSGDTCDNILKYDLQTGSVTPFVSAANTLQLPSGTVFTPDGTQLLGGTFASSSINKYNGTTGAPLGLFANNNTTTYSDTSRMRIGPNGDVYTSDFGGSNITRFNIDGTPDPSAGNTGAVFISSGLGGLTNPGGIAFATVVPEPLNILGAAMVVALGALVKRKLKK